MQAPNHNSLVDTQRDWFEAQVLAACLHSKAFYDHVSPVLCVHPSDPKKIFEDFSYPVDNLIYRLIQQYRNSSSGRVGTNAVPFGFLQVTAQAMAAVGDLMAEQVPSLEQRVTFLAAQPVEPLLPIIESSVSYWLGKSRAQKIATRASADPSWSPEDLVREISQSVDHAQHTSGKDYKHEIGDGRRNKTLDVTRIQCGLTEYDRRMGGGFGYKEFSLGIAGTGAGKTVLACQFATTFALNGYPGMLITTEQSHDQLEPRIYSNFCDIPFDMIKDGVDLDKLPPDKQAAVLNIEARLKGKLQVLNWNQDNSKSIVADLQNEVTKFKDQYGVRPHWLIFDWIGGALGQMSRQDMAIIRHVYQETADKLSQIAEKENMVTIAFAQAQTLAARNNARIDSSAIAECKTMGRNATTIFGISNIQENTEAMESGGNAPYLTKQYMFISKARKGVGGLIPIFRKFENQRFTSGQ
jgi:KaiC/GvpD/RAD55 family RecA-like ATPase